VYVVSEAAANEGGGAGAVIVAVSVAATSAAANEEEEVVEEEEEEEEEAIGFAKWFCQNFVRGAFSFCEGAARHRAVPRRETAPEPTGRGCEEL
jgi:hypothetical protein